MAAPRPSAVRTIRLPLDVSEDREFWDIWAAANSSVRRSTTART
jgi:hypothetical protein